MMAKFQVLGLSASLVAASAGVAQPPLPSAPINVPAHPGVVQVQPPIVQPPPAVIPVPPPPVIQTPPVVVPGVPVLPAQTALTLAQAERSLKCLPPGCHHLMFIHPVTCCPVAATVRISGCITDVRASKCFGTYKLTFRVKGHGNDVVVKFRPNGSVVVAD